MRIIGFENESCARVAQCRRRRCARKLLTLPITSHTTSSSNVNSTGLTQGSESHGSSFADKIHGLTEKLQALGHHRTDSEASGRPRTGTICHLSDFFFAHSPTRFFLSKTEILHFRKCPSDDISDPHVLQLPRRAREEEHRQQPQPQPDIAQFLAQVQLLAAR
ncbi:unnamed protein product [Trichogramma brassicae]|uniref:Uncharacterized protein n=1 Tax=Trichogramma brassicae TaxID=86971 RepID=A0A6H5IHF3_9HYME|nr:unnamed protein product [Trichogramma brassicae]